MADPRDKPDPQPDSSAPSSCLSGSTRREAVRWLAFTSLATLPAWAIASRLGSEEPAGGPPPSGVKPLGTRPTPLARNALVIDLSRFDPTKPLPCWDGKRPSQAVRSPYPADRDLLVLGHKRRQWTGGGFIRGGRHIHWIGGAYKSGPWLRDFMGDACMEGLLTTRPFAPAGKETGDSFSINPHQRTLGHSRIWILNCRTENVDGFYDGNHGDCFQLASVWGKGRYASCPGEVWIERFTGTTAYQGLFLPNQHFDDPANGYAITIRKLTLSDVNLRKTRPTTRFRDGREGGRVSLIFMIDMSDDKRGDRPYPKQFRNVFVEPYAGESLDDCIFPSAKRFQGINRQTGTPLQAILSHDGTVATYPPEMLLDGEIRLGPPPGGDFAKAPGPGMRGGLDVPGIGYISPGYTG